MNNRQTRQGSHSIRELLDWSKTVRTLRFFPGSGHGMGYSGEHFGVSLIPTAQPPSLSTAAAISDKLKQILEKEFPQFYIHCHTPETPADILFCAANGREQDGYLEAQDFQAAPKLEKRLEALSTELGFNIAVRSDAPRAAFDAADHA
jgi:hypothetical protein